MTYKFMKVEDCLIPKKFKRKREKEKYNKIKNERNFKLKKLRFISYFFFMLLQTPFNYFKSSIK